MEEQEGDEPPFVEERRAARCQPRRETRMKRLEQCIDTLTKLVSTLVVALGQNAANVAPTIPLGFPPANVEGEEVPPPQEGRDALAARLRLIPTHVKGALGVDAKILPKQCMKIAKPPRNRIRPNTLGIWYLTGLSE